MFLSGKRNLHHAGAEYFEHVNWRYHLYLSPEDLALQNSVLNAYQQILKIVKEDTPEDELAQGDHVSVSAILPKD